MCYDFSKLSGTLAKLPQFAVLVQGMREMYSRNSESGETMMSGKFLARASAFSLTLFLAACGGGDGSSSLAGGGDDGNGDDSNGTRVGTVQLLTSSTQIGSSESSSSTLTAQVKDNNGVLLEDIDVQFSVNNNGTLQVERGTTDASGTAVATLSPAGDRRNRTVTVDARSGNKQDSVDVAITGTSLAIEGPSSIGFGDTATYRVLLNDSEGNPIPGVAIQVSTNITSTESASLTTSQSGEVELSLTAAQSGGQDTMSVSAFSGESRIAATKPITISSDGFAFTAPSADSDLDINRPHTLAVRWLRNNTPIADGSQVKFSSTRGTISPSNGIAPTSNGVASVTVSSTTAGPAIVTAKDPNSGLATELEFEFVAKTPSALDVQANKTQLDFNETTEIIATVRDANNNLVKGQTVNFVVTSDGSNGSLSDSEADTDSQGKARVVYTGGNADSGRNGVVIRAKVSDSLSSEVNLTVTRQALRIALGTGNELLEPDTVRYENPFIAIVTDSNGSPVGADVELSVLPIAYHKGRYFSTIITDSGEEEELDRWGLEHTRRCAAEDANRNGVLDAGEDTNQNGTLEPTYSATTSSPSVTTSADGSANFSIIYPQSHCNWVEVELTATVKVGGTESIEKNRFILGCAESDLDDINETPPGGTTGLYGAVGSCSTDL
ncbi:Ig-like domain-containing protein [Marinobacter xestospongiae]|uniref:Ig-like domain-containing protein n=1 Tax=Marinobacter xestospongiae TaxID=994319 RepID=A0ABU3W0Z2_9GAMM|nr:Ig-like domain-containing protein [Marinobacter xestospongiae]MDV2080209.1 Ig-like domain-containing protein [Marinobacter xestospongiae]